MEKSAADDDDTDSDATTCDHVDQESLDELFGGGVEVIPDSQDCEPPLSLPLATRTLPSGDRSLEETRRGIPGPETTPLSPMTMPPKVASPLEEEGTADTDTPLQRDIGFDDQYFERPRFSHPPTNKRKPFTLSPPDVFPPVQIPAVLNQYLRDYQQQGVQFLYTCYHDNTGSLLCDDMGLGKTVQVIAFMCAILGKTGTKIDILLTSPRQVCSKGCFLVLCPSSVLYNWTSEIETWSHLKYGVYHRDKKDETLDRAKRGKLDVVLTTHDTARAHVETLNTVNWLAVFCDEVQAIKGTTTQVTAALNSLKARKRYGLTGTALQNKLTELWSILNWSNPGCLGCLQSFRDEFEVPILAGQRFDCTKRQLAQGRQKQAELEELMKQWVIRRTKALIAAQLPTKEEFVVFCPLTELQENIYRTIVDSEDAQLILRSGDPCDCYSGSKKGECCYRVNAEGVEWWRLVSEYLCLLTKCSSHLGLLLPRSTTSERQRQKAGKACCEAFSKHPQFLEMSRKASFLTLTDPKYCGKMQVLTKLLAKFKQEKAKVIIFSFSTHLLDILQDYLVSCGYSFCRLDGSTKIEERAHLVQSFNNDPTQFIFLISKKCGGVGLNVTGANRVIIYDPSWNPATDLQAEDRAFRIGQSRDVRVYRLVTEGTLEEMMYLRQVYKQQLANMTLEGSRERRYFTGVLGDRSQPGELFGYQNLMQLRRPGENLTLDILKRADRVEAGIRMAPNQMVEEKSSRQLQNSESDILSGATTLVHSGRKSVVGNSRVEEHISKQALADVYELEQHSQDPANLVENKLEDFSEESDDLDYQPPPTKKKQGGGGVSSSSEPNGGPSGSCKVATGRSSSKDGNTAGSDVEDEQRRALRHEHFEKMAEKCGYTSTYDFALQVRDTATEERQKMLDKYYGTQSKGSKGKGKSKATCKSTRLPPKRNAPVRGRRKTKKPALEFEDSSSPHETLSDSPEQTALPLASPRLSSQTGVVSEPGPSGIRPVVDTGLSLQHQTSLSLFSGNSYAGSRADPSIREAATLDNLFEETQQTPYHKMAESESLRHKTHVTDKNKLQLDVQVTPSKKPNTELKSLPSVNIDELFGI